MRKSPVFVVPVDFSPETESNVSAALAFAKHCGADVHLLEVIAVRPPSLLGEKRNSPAGRRVALSDWSRLERLVRSAQSGRTHVRAFAYFGNATEIIPAYLLSVKSTLLVMGRHYGTSGWRRHAGFVSTLSRAAPVPVLVLPPRNSSRPTPSALFRHIVSAVDFTIASAVAVQTVVDLSRRSGARLTLVHAVTATDTAYSGGQAIEVARNVRSETARISARLRRKIPADMRLRVDEHVTTGDPHRAILNVAKDVDADLIVMGVARRSRVDQALSGSTLRNVLRRTTVPILVLPVPAGARRCLDQTDGIEISLTPKSAVAGM